MLSNLLNVKVFFILLIAASKIFFLADIVPLIPSVEIIIVPLIPLFIKKNHTKLNRKIKGCIFHLYADWSNHRRSLWNLARIDSKLEVQQDHWLTQVS